MNTESLEKEAISKLNQIETPQALEEFRIEFLGKKGKLTDLMKGIQAIPAEEKKSYGQKVNSLKAKIDEVFQDKKNKLDSGKLQKSDPTIDETLPGIFPLQGRLHPITQTIDDISAIFHRLGFESIDGLEIETEFHNFTALNIPLDHTSRDSVDTFYTQTGHLLRSQTSTAQIRAMEKRKPPLRVIAPGRVYRPDTVDASHSFMFHQLEGLMVDEETTFADLKGILYLFLQELFGEKIKLRFRPHFFPFTEPSVEVDISWGKKGWLEILGAGTVNPKVFDAVKYDSKKVRGFAFGLGIERIAMLRHGINDIRHFYENDLRFLRQF